MSEQEDADIVEQAPRQYRFSAWAGSRARRLVLAGVIGALVIAAVAVTAVVALRPASGPRAGPSLTGLITAVTTVPVGKTVPGTSAFPASGSPGSGYSSDILVSPSTLTAVSGPALTSGGKPEVFYVGAEYCPYCAIENWPLIVALSRFGHFTGLAVSRSPEFEHIAPISSWTFYGTRYTSPYLAFVPVERYSNVRVSPAGDPDAKSSYRPLQSLTPAQQAVMDRYDTSGSVPFLDFGNRSVQTGSGPISPQLMTGRSWGQLAAALRQPKTGLGATLLHEADSLTAELCHLTGDRPAAACPAFIQKLAVP